MALASQDDLINDKHYVVVKTGEQGVASSTTAPAQQAGATTAATVPPALLEVPQSVRNGLVEIAPDAAYPIIGQRYSFSVSSQLQSIPEYAKTVSCSFVDASSTDVLKWLSKQGVNFAGASDSMPKGKLSLNLKNVPLHEALDSIAEVFGGSWNVHGKTLIFRSGRGLAFATSAGPAIAPLRSRVDPKRPYEIPMPAMPPMKAEGFELKIDDKMFKELAKVRDIAPSLSKEEFAKAQKDMAKAHEEMRKAIDLKMTKDAQLALTLVGPNQDLGKLMKSLSDKQWELHKKQGHLMFSDLTKEQLKMVAPDGKVDGKITITISTDGKTLTLKN